MYLEKYKSTIPERVSGDWKVERFAVSEGEAKTFNFRACFSFTSKGRGIVSGTYTKLTYKGNVIMSDTPAEILDHLEVILDGMGEVLVSGLGLGVVVEALLNKSVVTHVTVVELDVHVVDLVGSYLLSKFGPERLEIVHADIFEYEPPKGVVYDWIWHDIWPNICADNWPEMAKLKRKFARRKKMFQGCWCESEVQRLAAKERKVEREMVYWSRAESLTKTVSGVKL